MVYPIVFEKKVGNKKIALKSAKKYCTIITVCEFHNSTCMTGGSRITYRE